MAHHKEHPLGVFLVKEERIEIMVKHIILWNLKDEYNNDSTKTDMKKNLEALLGVIPGLLEIKVVIDHLDTSNVDVMLYSSFEDETALKNYAVHPEHVKVADTNVRPFVKSRACVDYIEN